MLGPSSCMRWQHFNPLCREVSAPLVLGPNTSVLCDASPVSALRYAHCACQHWFHWREALSLLCQAVFFCAKVSLAQEREVFVRNCSYPWGLLVVFKAATVCEGPWWLQLPGHPGGTQSPQATPFCWAAPFSLPSGMDEGTILPALCWIMPFSIAEHSVVPVSPLPGVGCRRAGSMGKSCVWSMWFSRLLSLQLNFPLPLVGEMPTEARLILPYLSQPGLLSLSEWPKITSASCPNVVHERLASQHPHRGVKCTAGVLSLGKKWQ